MRSLFRHWAATTSAPHFPRRRSLPPRAASYSNGGARQGRAAQLSTSSGEDSRAGRRCGGARRTAGCNNPPPLSSSSHSENVFQEQHSAISSAPYGDSARRIAAGSVLRTGRGESVEDVSNDPRFYSGIDQQSGFTTTGNCCDFSRRIGERIDPTTDRYGGVLLTSRAERAFWGSGSRSSSRPRAGDGEVVSQARR